MKEHIAVLRELGLTEKEAECYLALLKLGFATSGELMKLLRYYSKTVYQILDKLLGKGLVSYVIKANIKYFQAVDPHEFLDILNEQEDQLKIKVKKIEQIIPQLISLRALTKEHQEANMYVGSKGMKSVFDDALKETSEILVFGGGGKTEEFLGDYIKFWHAKAVIFYQCMKGLIKCLSILNMIILIFTLIMEAQIIQIKYLKN